MKKIISASILAANFACLGQEAKEVINAGADWIHFDVMDNHYVPHLTVGPLVCQALRDYGITAPIDVHLMTKPVDNLIIEFARAGAHTITFHPSASPDVNNSLRLIQHHGCKAGLAFNPEEQFELQPYDINHIDQILLMTVVPGQGGQQLIPKVLAKISQARAMLDQQAKPIRLAVDGGITLDNIAELARRGADLFVAGSAIFKAQDYQQAIASMQAELQLF